MNVLLAQMDALEAEYGYLAGDLNTDGLLNAAYHFYGEDLFADFYLAPERVTRLLSLIGELIVDVALAMRSRTGSCSISVNRMVERVDLAIFLHANCSVQMISPASYRQLHLPVEQAMARRIQPFGIHHCGSNLPARPRRPAPVRRRDATFGTPGRPVHHPRPLRLPHALLAGRAPGSAGHPAPDGGPVERTTARSGRPLPIISTSSAARPAASGWRTSCTRCSASDEKLNGPPPRPSTTR
jgi:hypothetical protein